MVFAPVMYVVGYSNATPFLKQGYEAGLTDMQTALDKNGVYTSWNLNADGSYTVNILGSNGAILSSATYKLDLFVQQIRDGKVIGQSIHTMTWTTAGLTWLADNTWNSAGVNVTQFARYIGASADATGFSAAWTALPAEIVNNGLGRALASWTAGTTGIGNLTKSFSVTGTQSTQLYGLYTDTYANAPGSTLVAAEQQGAGAVKNLLAGDTLATTIQCSAAGV
jgi:hypothetical protein